MNQRKYKKIRKFTTLKRALAKELKDPEFRKAWEEPTGDPFLDAAFEIIQARKERNLTQAQLAKKAGTTQQVIARLESASYRGHSLKALEKIAKALGKTPQIRFA